MIKLHVRHWTHGDPQHLEIITELWNSNSYKSLLSQNASKNEKKKQQQQQQQEHKARNLK